MTPKSAVTGGDTLHLNALTLGVANAIDYGIQFILPVVLTRALDPYAFGQYRLLWLLVSTILALAPAAMPLSLYYFLPRSEEKIKRLFINQTLVFLIVTSAIGALASTPLNPWLPLTMHELSRDPWVALFIWLWVVTSLMDVLPMSEERVRWQSSATVGLSIFRALILSVTAVTTHSFFALVLALVVFASVRLGLLLWYMGRYHGIGGPYLRAREFFSQVSYSLPFGASGALHSLRAQADQWIAAALFTTTKFAIFSVGSVLTALLMLFRQSINNAFLPRMNVLHAQGDVRGAVSLNNRANIGVALFTYPIFIFCFVFASQVITLVYTAPYIEAASVMRIYVFGLIAVVVELSSILLINRQGPYTMFINLASLLASVLISYLGAREFGVAGAAMGSVCAIYLERWASLTRIASLTGIPVRDLQEWKSLALVFGASLICGALTWSLKIWVLGDAKAAIQLAIGILVFSILYVPLLFAVGFGPAFVSLIKRIFGRES